MPRGRRGAGDGAAAVRTAMRAKRGKTNRPRMSRIGGYALLAALPLLSACASVIPEAGGARPGCAAG